MAAGGRFCPRPPTARPAPAPRRPPGPRVAPEPDSEPRPSALFLAGRAHAARPPPPPSFRGLGPGTDSLPDGWGGGARRRRRRRRLAAVGLAPSLVGRGGPAHARPTAEAIRGSYVIRHTLPSYAWPAAQDCVTHREPRSAPAQSTVPAALRFSLRGGDRAGPPPKVT